MADDPVDPKKSSSASNKVLPLKPIVWIYTDMSDKTLPGPNKEGTLNDPDDISAMAAYLLMANRFDTRKIVVASTHRDAHQHSPDQARWAQGYFGAAYRSDIPALNERYGGYPNVIPFMESSIKESSERFSPSNRYPSLGKYASIQSLFDLADMLTKDAAATDQVINVLCWGSLTEPAILVQHCLSTDRADVLKKLRFIAHWTNSPLHQGSPDHPERVANCREDAAACAFLKSTAAAGAIAYHECGAIGQHGIVSGSPKGKAYYDQFRGSRLGQIFVDGKFAYQSVDHSDSATFWVLLGDYGVTLDDVPGDGTNSAERERANEAKFLKSSHRLHGDLLRRSSVVAEKTK